MWKELFIVIVTTAIVLSVFMALQFSNTTSPFAKCSCLTNETIYFDPNDKDLILAMQKNIPVTNNPRVYLYNTSSLKTYNVWLQQGLTATTTITLPVNTTRKNAMSVTLPETTGLWNVWVVAEGEKYTNCAFIYQKVDEKWFVLGTMNVRQCKPRFADFPHAGAPLNSDN